MNRLDHLYTPWRMTYLTAEKAKANVDCVFCSKVNFVDEATDISELVVARSKFVYVVLNKFPYNNGHVMVIPYQHVGSIEFLQAEALTDMMLMVNHTIGALRLIYNPHGFNVGANLGGAAGAGIAEHVHMHIVPRWAGDTNYMTIVGETRIIPDTLEDTCHKLRTIWNTVKPQQ